MKRFSEQLHKAAQSVKLQTAEKQDLRERLVSYMEYHPLPAELREKTVQQLPAEILHTDTFKTIHFHWSAFFKSSAFAAALVLVVVPFAAEKAVPGDTLYAVKVRFNEELRSTLTFSGYEKVEWETERLNRRIAEARLLASEGRLTEEVEAEVAAAVREHADNAKREIAMLQTEDADEATIASIALDSTLEVQAATFKEGAQIAGLSSETVSSISGTDLIATAVEDSLLVSAGGAAATTSVPAYNKLMARVELNTTRIYELLGSLQATAPDSDLTEVSRRIDDLERSVAVAVDLSLTAEFEARQRLVDVLHRAQKLIVYMTELEVTETVDIEDLVPVVLTETEELAIRAALQEEIAYKVDHIAAALVQLADEGVLDKAVYSQEKLTKLQSQLQEATDLSQFKAIADEIIVLADDVITLLEAAEVTVFDPESQPDAATSTLDVIESDPGQSSTTEKTIDNYEEGELLVPDMGVVMPTTTDLSSLVEEETKISEGEESGESGVSTGFPPEELGSIPKGVQ